MQVHFHGPLNRARKPPALETARAQLAGFLSTPLIAATERPWQPAQIAPIAQAELLDRVARKAAPRRFTDEPITGFGVLA